MIARHTAFHVACTMGAIATLLLTACGGGSTGSATPRAGTSVAAVAKVSFTVKYPANFHTARSAAKKTPAAVKRQTAAKRSTQYVNPTTGDSFEIFVDGTLTQTLPLAQAVANADGSQTFTATVLSGTHGIEITEIDANSNILADGSNEFGITQAATNNLTLTLTMNAAQIAATTDPVAGVDAIALSPTEGTTMLCAYSSPMSVFPFAADPSSGFVLPGTPSGSSSNNGGIPTATLASQDDPGGSHLSNGTIGYVATFDATTNASLINAQFHVSNPYSGNTTTGWVTIGNKGSAPCRVSASFNPLSATAGSTSTLTITGGTPPYTVSESDGRCTFVAQNAPANSIWTATHVTSQPCSPAIADKNGTAPSTPPTLSGAPATLYFAGAYGVQACDENGNQVSVSGFSTTYATAITYDTTNQRFFVNDITASNLRAFDKSGNTLSVTGFASHGAGQNQLVFNPVNNHIYAAWNNSGMPDLLEWDSSGNTVTQTGGYPGIRGVGIGFDSVNQHLYVVDNDEYIDAFNLDGTVFSTPGGFPTVTSERFAGGDNIAVDGLDGRVFAVTGNTTMLVYDLAGNVVSAAGGFPGLSGYPVYDPYNGRVYSTQSPLAAWDINGNPISLSGSCYIPGAFQGVAVQ